MAIIPKKPLTPIGISIPIQRGNVGYFQQTYDTISTVKSNIITLLKTKRGERRFQPLLGSGLQNAIFEQNLDSSPDILKQIITNDIQAWIPGVIVTNVDLSLSTDQNNNSKDTYIVYIKVTFNINNVTDSVDLILQQNNI